MCPAQVLDSKNRPALTERALLANLTAILHDAGRTPPNQVAQQALGVLSTERRQTWAALRHDLRDHDGNLLCLDVIDKALFVVCLDDTSPATASEMCNNMLCGTYKLEQGVQVGTCTNRWYDKVGHRVESLGSFAASSRNLVLNLGTLAPHAAPDHCRRERSCRRLLRTFGRRRPHRLAVRLLPRSVGKWVDGD